MLSFWWNTCESKQKTHWDFWDKTYKPKNEGGLGFKDIGNFNQVLLAKQVGDSFLSLSLWLLEIFKGRYYTRKDFVNASIGSQPSYTWRSFLFGKELLEKGFVNSIGD